MAAKSNTGGIEKEFGHYDITWEIEDYSFVTFGDNWCINGPEIYVRKPTTKWKMTLKCENKDSVHFQLQRLALSAGPDTVQVQWRLSMMSKHGEKCFLSDRKFIFSCSPRKSWCFQKIYNSDILDILPAAEDTLRIVCQLTVSQREDSSRKYKKLKTNFEKNKEYFPNEAIEYYVLNKVTWNTIQDVQKYEIQFRIENVSDITKKTITSKIWKDAASETCWKMQMQLERVDEHIRIYVSAESVEKVKRMPIIVEFVAKTDDDKIIGNSKFPRFKKRTISNVFQIESLLPLPSNLLLITVKIRILLSKAVTVHKSQSSSVNTE